MNPYFIAGLLLGGLLTRPPGVNAQQDRGPGRTPVLPGPAGNSQAAAPPILISAHASPHAFPIVASGSVRSSGMDIHAGAAMPGAWSTSAGATPIWVDTADHWLVQKAAGWFRTDIQKATDQLPALFHRIPDEVPNLIIIGSLDASPLIRRLAAAHRIRVETLKGKWEAFSYQVVPHPFKGVGQALVIVGSDKRGTAYGVLELSRQMGVSPWYWWADVPVRKRPAIYLETKGGAGNLTPYFSGSPGVKYRGISINAEAPVLSGWTGAPALSGWTREKSGGVNHHVYERIFELLLRLKANYLWPAMSGNAFNDGDTLNPVLAGQYGIVMGASHHEPMLKWLNTNSIPRVWEQMHLAYDNDVRQIWVVNAGGLKPMELPISFFLDYAWNPSAWDPSRVEAYAAGWAAEQFGALHAAAIGRLLSEYTYYDSRRKPGLLSPDTYSLLHYREAEHIMDDYNLLAQQAEDLYTELPPEQRDAFYELVLYPVKASANLNSLYITAARNRLYAGQGRASADDLADSVRARFAEDSVLAHDYDKVLAGGKWDHMMDQTHIGYTCWREPRLNKLPELEDVYLHPNPEIGVSVEGSASYWTGDSATAGPGTAGEAMASTGTASGAMADAGARLPAFNVYLPQRHYIDIFNRGQDPFDYSITTAAPWLRVSAPRGQILKEQRVWISIDPRQAPEGKLSDSLRITSSNGQQIMVGVTLQGRLSQAMPSGGFVENDGYVSMNADHYTSARATAPLRWIRIPYVGKEGTGMTPFPVTAGAQRPGAGPCLSYAFYLFDTGAARLQTYCAPTLDYDNTGGLRFAVSLDDGAPQLLRLPAGQTGPAWNKMVTDNIAIVATACRFNRPGEHVLHFWMVDPGVVLEKIVIDLGGVAPSYLGPSETPYSPLRGIVQR